MAVDIYIKRKQICVDLRNSALYGKQRSVCHQLVYLIFSLHLTFMFLFYGLPISFCRNHLLDHDVTIALEHEKGHICDTHYLVNKTESAADGTDLRYITVLTSAMSWYFSS